MAPPPPPSFHLNTIQQTLTVHLYYLWKHIASTRRGIKNGTIINNYIARFNDLIEDTKKV